VLALYADALAAYRARRWDEAHVLFTACLEASPDDGPAAVLRDRCERFRLVPPPKGWDGVFEMDTK
jgi:adenylate cyclase